MLYRVHKHLENFLTFYYEHTKSRKTAAKDSSKRGKQNLQGSKGGKSIKVEKKISIIKTTS